MLGDSIKSLQTFFFENAKDNWLSVYSYKGTWSAIGKYNFFDYVAYSIENIDHLFLCINTNTPVGTVPTDDTYFKHLTLQGNEGVSGTGMAPRGVYSVSKRYYEHDCVAYNNVLWYATEENMGQAPYIGSPYWEKILEIDIEFIGADPAGSADEVRTEMNTLLNKKADINNPTFTGTPKAPTPSVEIDNTQIATTAFVNAAVALALSEFSVKPFHAGVDAPINTNLLWIDTGNSSIAKFHDGSNWVSVGAVWK